MRETYQIQMHPSRTLVFKRVRGGGRERELCFFKIYMPVFFLIHPYPHSRTRDIRIMVEGGFVFWKILPGDSEIPLLPTPLPMAESHLSRFAQLCSCVWSESIPLCQMSSSLYGNAIQEPWCSVMPLALERDKIRNRQFKGISESFQSLRWGHCLLCEQMSPK